MKRIGIITAAAMIFAAAADSSLDRFGDYDCFHEDQIKWCENKIEAGYKLQDNLTKNYRIICKF